MLAAARRHRARADAEEAGVLTQAVTWASLHEVHDEDTAACWTGTPLPIAGPGAPLVSEFCIAEFAAVLGLSTDSGRNLLAQAVELAHRLPLTYARVTAGDLQVWRARRIAERTLSLSVEAAAYVDRQIAPYAHRIGLAQTERLIDEAIARFMPETAAEIAERAADARHVTIHHDQVSFSGTSRIEGELDLADALDVADAITRGAEALKTWGSPESLDARRAAALGEMARGHAFLEAPRDHDPDPHHVSTSSTNSPVRNVTLYLHLSADALTGRLENHGPHLVTRDQIRDWCGNANVTVRPVIDLNTPITSPGYQPSDRLREKLIIRDTTCVFPWCTRSARGCDLDHIKPYDPEGPPGQTTTDNLAALCRRHHRLKTHGNWTYTRIEPGAYRWRSPHGYEYRRDRHGTEALTPGPVEPLDG